MTGAPDTARECFALAETWIVRFVCSEVVPQMIALCPEGQRALFLSNLFMIQENKNGNL